MVLPSPAEQPEKGNDPLKFLPCSPKQIKESIDKAGLRDKINALVQAFIARARALQQESAINEIREVDKEDGAPLK